MPYFHMSCNVELNEEQKKAMKSAFGRAVEDIPGKSERWLMVEFTDARNSLFFSGKDDPCAMVDVSVYGSIPADAFAPLTRDITSALTSNSTIPPDRIYVKYSTTPHWGMGGENF